MLKYYNSKILILLFIFLTQKKLLVFSGGYSISVKDGKPPSESIQHLFHSYSRKWKLKKL